MYIFNVTEDRRVGFDEERSESGAIDRSTAGAFQPTGDLQPERVGRYFVHRLNTSPAKGSAAGIG
jgi:hypothetical protein